jgi:hypothetical protein
MNCRVPLSALVPAVVMVSSCTRDDSQRRALLADAQRTNVEIARGAVVRDLRAPSDTGRLIYDSAVSLRERPARAAGARQVWAPFGIAQPDTTR